ncbi:MAG: hypothetical protein K6G87_02730 [Butyrivibrio sp.]|uniref:hypothetical protein n=1 Tax=Butyrivibrio sp. TaxID=28121 RepID=UPI0025F3B935|nr:hypothetical protein [Butyrivibrio sp.]MCR5770133.1 hypothetical protein [Butyrivibrio sp.]
MNLAIDCFTLIKDDQSENGIYELTKKLIAYLGAENLRRDNEHHIMVMGNTYNQNDFDADGTSFLLMDGDPKERLDVFKWENFTVASIAPKLGCDRIFFPCGKLPLHYKGDKMTLLYSQRRNGQLQPLSPDMMRRYISASRKAEHIIVTEVALENMLLSKVSGVESKIAVIPDLANVKTDPMIYGRWWTQLFRA